LYTQTTSPSDAYLYAQALYAGGEAKRAVYLLDRAGLLSSGSSESENDWTLLSRSVVLACQCLAILSEWEDISTLVTDLFRSAASLEHGEGLLHSQSQSHSQPPPPHASIQDLHDLDEELQQVWSLVRLGRPNSYTEICPVAQLCTWKGRAVEEGGNPRRAAKWLGLALEVDWKCVESWMYLCERQLLTWEEERDLILGLTRVIEQETKDIGNGETHQLTWLKDMYLARLSYWSGMQTNKGGLEKRGQEEGIQLEENAMNNDGNLRTPSVEEYRRRTRQTTTPDLRSPMISSILPEDSEPLDHHLHPGGGTPSMVSLMDASSIHYQPSPATSTPFDGTSPPLQESKDAGASHPHNRHRGPPPSQAEQAFQNLLFKHDLAHSSEVLTLAATRAYNSYNLPLALEYCQTLYEMDPLCPMAAPIQIATLVGLGHKRPLFRLAHALVDADPKSAVAWHAVGCYYYTCGRYDMAQRHFCRATRIEPRNAEGWIAFGCAFAMCDENDQANACFRAAQRLHAGSHYPMLYMGMEHLRTNNIPLSGHFLKSARSMGKNDPLCCNELGVWAYRKGDFRDSIGWFAMALRLYVEADMAAKVVMEECPHDCNNEIEGTFGSVPNLRDRDCIDFCQESFWEPTIFNVGQSYRKERRFQEAIFCFEKCLALCPVSPVQYSCMSKVCTICFILIFT
jgi:tetratricopeptide (TPR) repeat protein